MTDWQAINLRQTVRNAFLFCGNPFQAAREFCQDEDITFTGAVWWIVADELDKLKKKEN